MGPVAGKRAASRKGKRSRPSLDPLSLLLCALITASLVAWGVLVYAAIDFGTLARDGEAKGWLFMAVACLGAMACLFGGLMLAAGLLRRLGIITPDEEDLAAPRANPVDALLIPKPAEPRPVGGKRAAR